MQITKRAPNIVFIVLDTHRRDRMGCYGYPRGTSPNLDAFAREATVFENAISPAQWTTPVHASMFSGEFPSTHLTLQPPDTLSPRFRTLAQWLRANDYHTAGFCNNPLVGVLNNGFRRGFENFYNYGGAIPSTLDGSSKSWVASRDRVWAWYTQLLRKISYPIQNLFAKSDRFFQLAMHPRLVFLWTRYANFKGKTADSIREATLFVRQHMTGQDKTPHFLFINLMETHLPFAPPQHFVDTFAPQLRQDRAAWDFMRVYNTQALSWLLPMETPFSPLQARTLSDMYDAEVAYQDHLLAELLEPLDQPEHRENTMLIFVSDHGEMLGEHQLMGHGFGVYQELVHVPLMIRFPGQREGRRIAAPVSTRRLFHTVLDVAGVKAPQDDVSPAADAERLSLARQTEQTRADEGLVFSEAYPPQNVLKIMDTRAPHLINTFQARAVRRAAYKGRYKLIHVEGAPPALYDLDADPREQHDLGDETEAQRVQRLAGALQARVKEATARRPENWARRQAAMDDELLLERLRGLGYIE